MKIRKIQNENQNDYVFFCPGCGYGHRFVTEPPGIPGIWQFNNDFEKPTVNPSILVFQDDPSKRCHLFIKDGMIQFLGDCFHKLKNQTVPLEDF